MEFIVAGAIVGLLVAIALAKVIWIVVSQAVDNLLDWAILHFGNERAAREVEDKARRKEVSTDGDRRGPEQESI